VWPGAQSPDISMLRSVWVLGFALIFGSALAGGCGKKPEPVIAVVGKAEGQPFWRAVHAGAVAAGNELGVKILWSAPPSETDFTRQTNILDDLINQRVKGIALAPTNEESLVPIVERAWQEHIPVAIFDSGIGTEKYLTYISTDNYRGGALAADRMGATLSKQGAVAMIGAAPGTVSTMERENGFRETIARKYPTLQIVGFQYSISDPSQCLAAAEDILTQNPDLSAMFCSNGSGTECAVQAAKSHGVAGRLKIIGFNSSPELIAGIDAGTIDALVLQDSFQMGYLAVKALAGQLRGKPPARRIDTRIALVTRSNLRDPAISDLVSPPIARYLK
jgi:ribose transport system substrate-binding protein